MFRISSTLAPSMMVCACAAPQKAPNRALPRISDRSIELSLMAPSRFLAGHGRPGPRFRLNSTPSPKRLKRFVGCGKAGRNGDAAARLSHAANARLFPAAWLDVVGLNAYMRRTLVVGRESQPG